MQNYNLQQTADFLKALDPKGLFTFLAFDDRKTGAILPTVRHGKLEDHAEEFKRLNQAGAGIFVTINETNGEGRKATDIVRVRAHFVDSDNEPIEEVCKRFPLKPHMVVETSEGKGHAYYLASDTQTAEFKEIQERMIEALGTDPAVKDLPRTMRLPGFYHMKGEPRLVNLVQVEEGLPHYRKAELLAVLPTPSQTHIGLVNLAPQSRQVAPSVPQSDGARTETLTSLTGSLLARGMDDEEIFNWLTAWNNNNTPPLPDAKVWETIQSLRKADQRNHPERYGSGMGLTEAGNAKLLVALFGEDVRYCHDRKEWLLWDSQRWIWDTTDEITRRAMAAIEEMGAKANAGGISPETVQIKKWVKQSFSASGIKNMISLAQADLDVATMTSQLDKNDWLLNTSNGTLDLKELEFRPHSREDLNTKMAPVEFRPEVSCPNWLAFLDKIFNGDQELISWLQKVVGYTLTGSTDEQSVFFLIGDGCNGKSTFLNVLKAVLGDYAVQANPDTFMASRYSSAGGTRSDLIRLAGARMTVASEGEEGQRLAESLIKQVTGGEEISVRGLYQKNQIEYTPRFKLFFCSNHKPMISGTDFGIWRRIRVIPFSVCIPEEERDPGMMKKLCAESSGILNWAYDGCTRWQIEGLNDIPASVQRAVEDYQGENDVIGRFLAERCERGGRVGSSDLYQAYGAWSQENGEDRKGQAQFSQYLTRRGYEKVRNRHGFHWSGIHTLDSRGIQPEAVAA